MKYTHCVLYLAGISLSSISFTYDDLSKDKVATQSSYPTVYLPSLDARNAIDRNTSTCMRTDTIGENSLINWVWWKVDLGGVYSIFRINILFKNYEDIYENRQRGRFAGFSLYVSNTDPSSVNDIQGSTLCYKNDSQLPPLNFTAICTKYGRYVIFYNERWNSVIYPTGYESFNVITELCEVIAEGCKNARFYGKNCENRCPANCKDNTCHIEHGTCFKCKSGWTGMYCNTTCKEGWYGEDCRQPCGGHCREKTNCNHVTGQCDAGCDAGWTGVLCDKECADGTFGYNCTSNCSGHCQNDSSCNKQTGHCARGCNPGYTNDDCNKECSSGRFGMNCGYLCSGHCKNNETCDHVSGVCFNGCQDGFVGTICNNSCNKGHFGTNCSRVCSPYCKPETCRHTDGSCISCAAGWMGHNCTKECSLTYGENCQYPCNVYCINKTCDRINGSCLYGCKEREQCDMEYKTNIQTAMDDLPLIVGGIVCTLVIVIIGVVLAFFVIRLKRKSTTMAKRQSFILESKPLRANKPKTEQSKLPNCRLHTLRANDVGESTYALPERTKRGLPTNKNISRGELHPCTEGKKLIDTVNSHRIPFVFLLHILRLNVHKYQY